MCEGDGMEEWKECKLGDFFELHRGYDLTKSEIKTGPYPVVCSTSIMGYHSEYKVRAPGVVICRSGTLGEVQFIDKDFWPHNTSLYVSDFKGNSPKFIKYFLQLFGTGNVGGGSAVPTLNRNHLQALAVKVPPLPTQQKIATILSSLDDKIELNNKINTNLEQQAQAIFKNWFVDFEPFGGKMPEGWKVGKLSDIADYLNGLAMQKFRPLEDEEGLPVLKIKELRQGCCDESSELCSPSKVKAEYIIHDGDVIFSWSGSLLVDIWCGGTCGLNQHQFKVTSKTYEKWFYYLWTKHHLDRFIFLAADKATTMGHIKREELDKAEVIILDDKIYSKLTMTLSPIIDTIINNRVENRRLSEIRDNLLPELMSGNINVEDITI